MDLLSHYNVFFALDLNGRLHWGLVVIGPVHLGSISSDHFGSLASVTVHFHQLGQLEAGLLQHLDLQLDAQTFTLDTDVSTLNKHWTLLPKPLTLRM